MYLLISRSAPPKGPKQNARPTGTSNGISKTIIQPSTLGAASNVAEPTSRLGAPIQVNAEPSISRGPSPPLSRPPTPVQSLESHSVTSTTSGVAVSAPDGPVACISAASVPCFSATSVATALGTENPCRAVSAEPSAALFHPAIQIAHRAASAQPAPSNWTGSSFSVALYTEPNNGDAIVEVNKDSARLPRTASPCARIEVVCAATTTSAEVSVSTAIPRRTESIKPSTRNNAAQPLLTNHADAPITVRLMHQMMVTVI